MSDSRSPPQLLIPNMLACVLICTRANFSVALVGPSGCGKSTTVQMLERFYDPLIGKVTLDGVDIRELNVASYRSEMALVSQEPTLYAGTVRFNVVLGANKPMEQVTDEEVVQACKDANIVSVVAASRVQLVLDIGR